MASMWTTSRMGSSRGIAAEKFRYHRTSHPEIVHAVGERGEREYQLQEAGYRVEKMRLEIQREEKDCDTHHDVKDYSGG